MYKKVIVITIVIAFACLQIANSLTCQQCNSPDNCKKVNHVTCNNATSTTTRLSINSVFGSNIPEQNSTTFDCISRNETINNNVGKLVKGCLARELVQTHCSKDQNCTACSGNNCNDHHRGSPAGTFSSSALTIIATVMGVFVAKTFSS